MLNIQKSKNTVLISNTVEPWDYGHCKKRPPGPLRPPPAVPHFCPLNKTQIFPVIAAIV